MVTKILTGDCRALLKTIDSESIDCCVTSPPYFGLRDYGNDRQIGLERTPDDYVAALLEVFREVRRVLRKDGTLWLNLGDSYAGSMKGIGADGKAYAGEKQKTNKGAVGITSTLPPSAKDFNLKPKDLIGIPWRVAFALQADGWYLRQDIIWSKPNPMPESVTDRCTKAHEYIFLLSKAQNYHYDADAIRQPLKHATLQRDKTPRGRSQNGGGSKESLSGYDYSRENLGDMKSSTKGANKRSVWTINTKPYRGAHFATFPPELIEPCLLAGCPKGGTVLDPFAGSGTTGLVAKSYGRNSVLMELNPDYVEIIEKRINKDAGLFTQEVRQ